MVDGRGRVVTTIFAATTSGPRGGYGVPNAVVRSRARRLERAGLHRSLRRSPGRRAARYPRPAMAKTLVLAEKPSVGRDLTRALPGQFAKHEGYLESDSHVVTWAVGHLVQLAEPDEYDAKYKKWRMADLPIIPDDFRLEVRDERSRKQMTVITRLLQRKDVDEIVNACDAGREGELIFAWTLEKSGVKKPVKRLWLSSMTVERDQAGVRRPAARARSSPSSRRRPARARRPTGSSA